jgi:hypothetical protein
MFWNLFNEFNCFLLVADNFTSQHYCVVCNDAADNTVSECYSVVRNTAAAALSEKKVVDRDIISANRFSIK